MKFSEPGLWTKYTHSSSTTIGGWKTSPGGASSVVSDSSVPSADSRLAVSTPPASHTTFPSFTSAPPVAPATLRGGGGPEGSSHSSSAHEPPRAYRTLPFHIVGRPSLHSGVDAASIAGSPLNGWR